MLSHRGPSGRLSGEKGNIMASCTERCNIFALPGRGERWDVVKVRTEREWKAGVLRRLGRLADRRVNDAVKLAFLGEGELKEIDGLDLASLTELKRHGNGAVEIRLVDKLLALEKLYDMAGRSGEGAERFFQDLQEYGREGRDAEKP